MNPLAQKTIFLPDETATLRLGKTCSAHLGAGLRVYLEGDLGAGKTTFVRGFLHALGVTERIKSPTYALVHSYPLEQFTVHHFDLYRFSSEEEWLDAGFNDYFNAQSLCFIEWSSYAQSVLLPPDLQLSLSWQPNGREVTFSAFSIIGQQCLAKIS